VFVIPLVIAFAFVYSSFVHVLEAQALERLHSEQEKGALVISSLLENAFSQYIDDLLLVYNSNEFGDFVRQGDEEAQEAVSRLFVRIADNRSYIRQVRFIDREGMERIRINHTDRDATIVEDGRLQDKREMDYFKDSCLEEPGTIHISGIDLNVEHGEVVFPYEPILRMSMPVYRDGESIGVLVINFDGYHMLSFFSAYHSSLLTNLSFGLVNNEGAWIVNNEVYVFGSSFEDSEENNLFVQEPGLRDLMFEARQVSGQFSSTRYFCSAITPDPEGRIRWVPGGDRIWTVVSYFGIDQVALLDRNILLDKPHVMWVGVLLILSIGISLVLLAYQRKNDKDQQKVSSLISNYAKDGIIVTDKYRRITFCNRAFEILSGYSQEELIGKTPQIFSSDSDHVDILIRPDREDGQFHRRLLWDRDKNGNFFLTYLGITAVKDYRNIPEFYVGVYTQFKGSFHTGISDLQVEGERFPMPPRYIGDIMEKGKRFYCVFLQIANYEEFDYRFREGERYRFAATCAGFLADSFGCMNPISIYSPDIYLLVFTDCDSDEAMAGKLERLFELTPDTFVFDGKVLPLVPVCGISGYPDRGSTPENLFDNACLAREMIGPTKESSYRFFDQDLYRNYLRRQAIAEWIPQGFLNHEFALYYQPQVDIATNRIIGAEALIRWISPTLGFVSPAEMLPVIEKNGFMPLLSDFVIETAISFLDRHRDVLRRRKLPFILAINLTAEDIANGKTIDSIMDGLARHDVDPKMLEIELTENNAVESFLVTERNLQRLRGAGIPIAMDDFGTGFSSLSYLQKLSMDKIKIDQAFIRDYPGPKAVELIHTIIGLGKNIGVDVLAEGVETEQQLEFLRDAGCDEIQGYLFSKPVGEEAFLEMLCRGLPPDGGDASEGDVGE
jgi:PAS domain S-box-containing protein